MSSSKLSLSRGPPQVLSYPDTVSLFNQESVAESFKEACEKLAQSHLKLLQTFETLSSQLSSLDLQHKAAPMTPTWKTIQKDFFEILRQHRLSAGLVSGRLKMFFGLILPRTTRNVDPKSIQDKIHVLQSYVNISSDHSALADKLVDTTLMATDKLHDFYVGFSKISCEREAGGSASVALTSKLEQLKDVLKQLCASHRKNTSPDPSLLATIVLRISSTTVRRSSRRSSLIQRVALTERDSESIGKLYNQLDDAKNELAHAHYSIQLSCRKTDTLSTVQMAMSNLLSDIILTVPTGLSLFMVIWATLRIDCVNILTWLKHGKPKDPPSCIDTFTSTGGTLYSTLAAGLDIYVAVMDSYFMAFQR